MNMVFKVAFFGFCVSMLVSCGQSNNNFTSRDQLIRPQSASAVEINDILDISVTLNHTHRSVKNMTIFQGGVYKVVPHYGAHSIWVGITNRRGYDIPLFLTVSSDDKKIVDFHHFRHIFTTSAGFGIYEVVFDTPIDATPIRAKFGTATITLTATDTETGAKDTKSFQFTTKPDPQPFEAYCPTPPNCPESP